MSENEIRSRIVTLAFGGDERLFMAFHKRLEAELPPGTGIVLRGSEVKSLREGRASLVDGGVTMYNNPAFQLFLMATLGA